MSWTDGVTRATGDIVTATDWNNYLGAAGSLMQLKSHAHGGTTGEGSTSLGPLVLEDFTDAAAPAAPGASKTRVYTVSGKPRYRAGAAGADRQIITDESTASGDLAGTYPSPTVAKITLGSDADGDIYYRASSVLARLPKGTGLQVLRMNSGATAPEWATPAGITIATEQATTSGTSIDFTGIPSTAKRITVMFKDVSTNGSSKKIIQLGDSGGAETTGYTGASSLAAGAWSSGARLQGGGTDAAGDSYGGTTVCTLENASTNTWTITVLGQTGGAVHYGAGYKATSATLDRVRLTTENGTDAFDAGAVSISYE